MEELDCLEEAATDDMMEILKTHRRNMKCFAYTQQDKRCLVEWIKAGE